MRFKIDVSDRETGEITTLEVEAPTARAARRYLESTGFMIWATEPIADSSQLPPRFKGGNQQHGRACAPNAGLS
jgi:hypothetical protein